MKKYIYIILIIISIVILIPKQEQELRIRVIANSNSEVDQKLKMMVVRVLLEEINSYESESIINEIKNNLENLDTSVKTVLKDKKYNLNFLKLKLLIKNSKVSLCLTIPHKTYLSWDISSALSL